MKNILIKAIALVLGVCTAGSLHAAAGGDMNTTTFSCAGQNVTCKQSMNAVGDRIQINTQNIKVRNLGVIDTVRNVQLLLPPAKQMLGYSLTPATGALAGQRIDIVMLTDKDGKDVKFYRHIRDDRGNWWTEAGEVLISNATKPIDQRKIAVTIAPNGTVSFVENNELKKICLGAPVLGVNVQC